MYKIIGADGKEYGPVTLEQLRQWVTERRVNAQTKILPDGAAAWVTLGELPEFATASVSVLPPISAVGGVPEDYHIDIGTCLTRGWELVKTNLGFLVGGSLLVFLLLGAIQAPGDFGRALVQMSVRHRTGVSLIGLTLAAFGTVLAIFLTGPVMGGLYWPYLRLLRQERAEIGDFFVGFRRGFFQLMLCQLATSLLIVICLVPPALVLGVGATLRSKHHSPAGVPLLLIGGVGVAVAAVFAVYLSVCWFFALPLVVDKQLSFWEAMKLSKRKVSQHWWQVFGLMFVAGLIGAAGILLCCVGLLFTLPLAIAAAMSAYEIIFGRRDNAPASA